MKFNIADIEYLFHSNSRFISLFGILLFISVFKGSFFVATY